MCTDRRAVTDLRFDPKGLTIHVGDTVVWTISASNEIHTVAAGQTPSEYPSPAAVQPAGGHDYMSQGYFDSALLPPVQSYSLRFTQPGTFPACARLARKERRGTTSGHAKAPAGS